MKQVSLFAVAIFMAASVLTGCSGAGNLGPTVKSMEEYQRGEFSEGWLYGMTPAAMHEYALGILDIRTRLILLDLWKQQYSQLDQNVPIGNQIGKVIIKNERHQSVTIGVEGPMNKEWYVGGNQELSDNLIPGNYIKWYDNGHGKQYVFKKDKRGKETCEYDILSIGFSTSNYNGITTASGLLIYK